MTPNKKKKVEIVDPELLETLRENAATAREALARKTAEDPDLAAATMRGLRGGPTTRLAPGEESMSLRARVAAEDVERWRALTAEERGEVIRAGMYIKFPGDEQPRTYDRENPLEG